MIVKKNNRQTVWDKMKKKRREKSLIYIFMSEMPSADFRQSGLLSIMFS